MDTIKELYYGNINPCERDVEPGSETDQLAKLILRLDTQLKESLNESEAETFGKLKDVCTELSCSTATSTWRTASCTFSAA